MKTFFTVKFALLPIAVFVFLIVRGMPAAAIGAGFAVALVVCAWRLYAHDIKTLEIAALAIFGALACGILVAHDVVAANAVPLAFAGLGVFSIATVLSRKPWTAEFSRAAYPGAEESPVFVLVNMIVSGLWGVLFLLLALAHALKAGGIVTTAIVLVGAAVSILGPRFLVHMALARRMVQLSGRTVRDAACPTGDIEIAVIGMRPGEKLHEELLIGNQPEPTAHSRIMKAHEPFVPWTQLAQALQLLEAAAVSGDRVTIKVFLQQHVHGYQPGDNP